MKKFVFVFLLVLFCPLVFTGCSQSSEGLIKGALAEVTEDYFFGQNTAFSLSISVGRRENPYMIDGKAQALVDFSLLVFKDKSGALHDDSIDAGIVVNGKKAEVCLEYNPIAGTFMVDLGYRLGKNDIVEFEYSGRAISLNKISDGFHLSSDEAIRLASKTFKELIASHKTSTGLNGECYLKVLGQKDDGGHLYWCFTFVNRSGKSYNLIISVEDGKVIASDF